MIKALTLPIPACRVELAEGGDLLPDQTYHIIGYFSKYGGYYGQWCSAVQDELSITTTQTHRSIKFTVGYNDDNGQFVAGTPSPEGITTEYKFKWDLATMKDTDGNYYKWLNPNTNSGSISKGHNRWSHKYTKKSEYVSDFTLTSIEEGEGYQSCSNFHPQISSNDDTESCFLQSYVKDKGNVLLCLKDGENDFDDLCQALKNVDSELYHIGYDYVDFFGSIDGSGTLTLNNKQLVQYFGNVKSNNVVMNNCNYNIFDFRIWNVFKGQYDNCNISSYGILSMTAYKGQNNRFQRKDYFGNMNSYGSSSGIKIDNHRFYWGYPEGEHKLSDFYFNNSKLYMVVKNEGAELHDVIFKPVDTDYDILLESRTAGNKVLNFYNISPNLRIQFGVEENVLLTVNSYSRHTITVDNLPDNAHLFIEKNGEFFKEVNMTGDSGTFDILREKYVSMASGKADVSQYNGDYVLVIESPETNRYEIMVNREKKHLRAMLCPSVEIPDFVNTLNPSVTADIDSKTTELDNNLIAVKSLEMW
jgi:hypothetical protein